MGIIQIFLTSVIIPLNATTIPLDRGFESIQIDVATTSINIDFFFDKTGNPEGGIILTQNEAKSRFVSDLANSLSQHGWSVAVTDLNTDPPLPARTRQVIANPLMIPENPEVKSEATDSETTTDQNNTPSNSEVTTAATDSTEETLTPAAQGPEADQETQDTLPPDTISDQPSPMEKLKAVTQFMKLEKGQLNLVFLALQDSWITVNEYLVDTGKNNIQGLVLLNVKPLTPSTDLPNQVPILEIDTNRVVSPSYQVRKVDSRRFKISGYQQIHLPSGQLNGRMSPRLAKRIRGWLSVNVKGMEINKETGSY